MQISVNFLIWNGVKSVIQLWKNIMTDDSTIYEYGELDEHGNTKCQTVMSR